MNDKELVNNDNKHVVDSDETSILGKMGGSIQNATGVKNFKQGNMAPYK